MLSTDDNYNNTKKGFTMVELVFVIVILGILASVAIPRLAATRDDAIITKGRSEVATIRSAIVSKRSENILSGGGANFPDVSDLEKNTTSGAMFSGLLPSPIYAKTAGGRWRQGNANNEFIFRSGSSATNDVTFTYTQASGTFDCDHSKSKCKELAE